MNTSKENRFVFDSFLGIINNVIAQGSNLFIGVVIGRFWGAATFGDYSGILTLVGTIGIVCNFGTQVILGREVARCSKKFPLYMSNALGVRLFISTPSTIILSAAVSYLFLDVESIQGLTLFLIIIYAIGLGLQQLFFTACLSLGHMKAWAVNNSIFKVLSSLAVMLCALADTLFFGVISLFTVLCFCSVFLLYLWQCKNIRFFYPQINIRFAKAFIMKSFPLSMGGMAEFLNLRLDTILILAILGSTQTGYYSVAAQIYLTVSAFPLIFLKVFSPIFIEKLSFSKHTAFALLIKKIWSFLCSSIIIGLLMGITAPFAVTILYGDSFFPAVRFLVILCFAFPFLIMNRLFINILVALREENFYVRISWVGVFINVLGNYFMIPVIGASGAAFSTCITEAFICFTTGMRVYSHYQQISGRSQVAD